MMARFHRGAAANTQAPEAAAAAVAAPAATPAKQDVLAKNVGAEKFKTDASWIKGTIKKRICTRYVKSEKSLPGFAPEDLTRLGDYCECGHLLKEHSSQAGSSSNTGDWNIKDTETEPTDAYGELDFVDSTRRVAKYVRIDEKTDAETIKHLLFKIWKLGKPTLVISVIGGSKSLQAKPQVAQAVRRGLLKVVRSGAWLLTNGLRQGVTRIVGDVISSSDSTKAVCLGIVPWGVVSNRHQLVTNNPRLPAWYTIPDEQQKGLNMPLDPNHTHFLLVDNGTARLQNTDVVMRSKVEEVLMAIRQPGSKKFPKQVGTSKEAEQVAVNPEGVQNNMDMTTALQNQLNVPLCIVLCGGSLSAFDALHDALKRGTPVVVVKGSGRIADTIEYAMQQLKTEDSEKVDRAGETTMESILRSKFSEGTEEGLLKRLKENDNAEECSEVIHKIMFIISEFSSQIDFFEVTCTNTGRSLDLAILLAVLRSGKSEDKESRKLNQLMFALQWNRSDIAETEILTSEFKIRTSIMTNLFSRAIAQNRAQFAKLLLDQGFNMRTYLTKDTLTDLYNQKGDSPFSVTLSKELQRGKKKQTFTESEKRPTATLQDIGRAITTLCTGSHYCTYMHDNEKCDVSYTGIFISLEDHIRFVLQKTKWKMSQHEMQAEVAKSEECNFGDPALHLFFYCVLFNKKDTALLFWDIMPQKLGAAQLAAFLLQKMVPYTTDRDVRQAVLDNAAFFNQLSVGVLDSCYSADQSLTHLLILREMREFSGTTCVDLADSAGNMPFIAHPASQTLMSTIWQGEISKKHNILVKLICLFCPPLIPLLIRFHAEDAPDVVTTIAPPKLPSDVSFEDVESSVRPPTKIPFQSFRFIHQILHYYFTPQITFLTNVVAYLVFLMLYTELVLGNYIDACASDFSGLEILMIIWALCLFIEEIRQLLDESGSATHKLCLYLSNPWNQLDILSITCFLVAEMLGATEELCYASIPWIRALAGIAIFNFYNRLLQFFSANESIGPKLVMIFRMFKDIIIIMTILVVMVMSFTVVVVSMLNPDQPMSFERFTGGLSKVYWSMFGELPLDDMASITKVKIVRSSIFGSDSASNTTAQPPNATNATEADEGIDDPIGGYYMVAFLGLFVILTNLLLFNVLIAMFNYTFSVVQEKADEYWSYQRYKLIMEYFSRPPVPPPFLLIYHFWLVIRFFYRKIRERVGGQDNSDSGESACALKCDESVERQLTTWENLVVDDYMESLEKKEKETLDNQVVAVREQVNSIKDSLVTVGSSVDKVSDSVSRSVKNDAVEKNFASLETRVKSIEDNVQKILQIIVKGKS